MESVDVDCEIDEILKEVQETNSEGENTSDTVIPNAQISSSGDSPNLEAITLPKNLWQSMVQVAVDR